MKAYKKATLIEKAIEQISDFAKINTKLERKIKLNSLASSTYYNYTRSITKVNLHFKPTPLELTFEEIEDYLLLQKRSWQPSESYFKHTVYGLRFLFRIEDSTGVGHRSFSKIKGFCSKRNGISLIEHY